MADKNRLGDSSRHEINALGIISVKYLLKLAILRLDRPII